ncbi:MAG: hypothetical protein M3250_02650 [Thermoproteota archaeon]|nr:hypothetical protein [Thermoproteota archaeon]
MIAGDSTINGIRKAIHIHPAVSEAVARGAEAIDT